MCRWEGDVTAERDHVQMGRVMLQRREIMCRWEGHVTAERDHVQMGGSCYSGERSCEGLYADGSVMLQQILKMLLN
jgi:hypothetical protein